MEQHYILCGLGRIGERVVGHLRRAGVRVVVIDNRCAPGDPRLGGAELVCGDCRRPETLEQAGLAKARGVLIVTSDDLVSLQTALMVRNLHPGLRVVVRMFNQNLMARLGSAVANIFALSTSALAAPLLAQVALTGEALGAYRPEDGTRHQVAEFTVAAHAAFVGQPVAEVARQYGAALVAHLRAGEAPRFLHEVDGAALLAAGDRVVVSGEPAALEPLLARGENESLPEILWAGLMRRLGRVLWRGIALVDVPVKICTLILAVVIVFSVLVFRYGMKNDTLVDAFYRTVSLIATGADMHGHEVAPGTWQKGYISLLRLVGMALVAAFTAIFTNYLVRANLGGALEVRRIPDSGHIIVCGLGNIGYRVVAELLAQGEQVVVIEPNRDNTFIATARRQKAAVIIGNAAVTEVLKQAHAASARAVVAATNNELINVEIALLVRELAPKQRVVVRVIEPHLAQTLRQAANIRLAMSIPELAAPAFVAALFGDLVRGMVLVEGQLLAVYDMIVHDHDARHLGQTIGALENEYHFVAVHWTGKNGAVKAVDSNGKLEGGERLTVIISLQDLQRVSALQRERVMT